MTNKLTMLALASAIIGLGLVGCTQEGRDKMGAGAEKVGEGIRTDAQQTGEAVEQTAENAAENVQNAAENAAETSEDALMTGKVKNGIVAAADIDSKDVNVETIDKVVHLRGSVPNAKQKNQAQKIAEGIAGSEYKVKNELTVGGTATSGNDADR